MRQGAKTVFRTRTRMRKGRYVARIKTPAEAGRLTIVVRAAGQRVTRFSVGR